MPPDPHPLTSLTLLREIGNDDHEAWGRFTKLYGPIVYGWCRNAGLQPEDVDDVGQEVFRIVSLKLGTFEPGRKSSGAFRSWLWGITRLEILDHARAACGQPVGRGGTDHNLNLHQLEADTKEPETVNGQTPQQLLLQSAIDILRADFDPSSWQAFWEMAVNSRTAGEIGAELNMTAKAVRQAKFRVTKRLRELLSDDLSDLLDSPQ